MFSFVVVKHPTQGRIDKDTVFSKTFITIMILLKVPSTSIFRKKMNSWLDRQQKCVL